MSINPTGPYRVDIAITDRDGNAVEYEIPVVMQVAVEKRRSEPDWGWHDGWSRVASYSELEALVFELGPVLRDDEGVEFRQRFYEAGDNA